MSYGMLVTFFTDLLLLDLDPLKYDLSTRVIHFLDKYKNLGDFEMFAVRLTDPRAQNVFFLPLV